MLLVYPGELSEVVLLVDVLKEAHNQLKSERAEQIKNRERLKIPLDDTTNWQAVEEIKKKITEAGQDSSALFFAAKELAEQTTGNKLEQIGEFVAPEHLQGIRVQFKMISVSDSRLLSAKSQAIWKRYRDALISGDSLKVAEAVNQLEQANGEYICAVLNRIEGLDLQKPIAESIDALEAADLLLYLAQACKRFLELPRPKALRCGLPAQ